MMDNHHLHQRWQSALHILKKAAPDGWWPYYSGQKPSAEATAWCSIALRHDKEQGQKVINYFIDTQNCDGGWSTEPGSGESDWSTAPVILAVRTLLNINADKLKSRKRADKSLDRGINYLLNHQAEVYNLPIRLAYYLLKGPSATNHFQGWPWTSGCAHWVEPTSYALIALKAAHIKQQKHIVAAVSNASKFLLDHACKGGGWNHGNNFCLQVDLPPYPVTTAEAIIALQDWHNHQTLKDGVAYLSQIANDQTSIMSLSWLVLAYDTVGLKVNQQLAKLLQHQREDGTISENFFLAGLACCALGVSIDDNPLKFSR